jgi:hypothetical protein
VDESVFRNANIWNDTSVVFTTVTTKTFSLVLGYLLHCAK